MSKKVEFNQGQYNIKLNINESPPGKKSEESPTFSSDYRNLYIREHCRSLGLPPDVRDNAEKIYQTLLLKNLKSMYEKYLPLVCIFISAELRNKPVTFYQMNKVDETRIIIADFLQLYNQAVSALDIRTRYSTKQLSYELVKWGSIYEEFKKDKIKTTFNSTVESFFWLLFIILVSKAERQHPSHFRNCNVLRLFQLLCNFKKFMKTRFKMRNLSLFFHEEFTAVTEELLQFFQREYVQLRLSNQSDIIAKMAKTNLPLLEKLLNMNDNVMYIRVTMVTDADWCGMYHRLTTVKYVNFFNQTRMNSCVDLVLQNMTTNWKSIPRYNENPSPDNAEALRVGRQLGLKFPAIVHNELGDLTDMFVFAVTKMVKRETDRLKEEFQKKRLLENESFNKALCFCCMVTSLFSTGNLYALKIRNILRVLGLSPLVATKMIEPFLRDFTFLDSPIKQYFKYVERKFFCRSFWRVKPAKIENKIIKRKLYQFVYQRVYDMCGLVKKDNVEGMENSVFKLVFHILENHSHILVNRSLDLIVICSVYMYVGKILKQDVSFSSVMMNYRYLVETVMYVSPIEVTKVLFNVPLEKKMGNTLNFYNQMFVHIGKEVVFDLEKVGLPEDLEKPEDNINLTPKRRKRLSNTNLYLSRRSVNPSAWTPRTKELYSFGEFQMEKGEGFQIRKRRKMTALKKFWKGREAKKMHNL